MKKTLFTFIFALLAAAGAWAQFTFTVDNLEYMVIDATANRVLLTGYETPPTGILDIPATVIYETTVYSVTGIDEEAFDSCQELIQITISEGVTTIAFNAFVNCSALTQITLPASLTTIREDPFKQCTALTQIHVDEANPAFCSDENGILFNKDKTQLICYPAGKTEATYTIPEGVTSIGYYAFCYSTTLKSVIISESVTSIESRAFSNCNELRSITLPNSVTSIESGAFSNCTSLTQITLPASLTTIKKSTFAYCTSLTSITLPESLTKIEFNAFYGCSSLATITLPNSVTEVGTSCFENCTALMRIHFGTGMREIGSSAFRNCVSLMQISLSCTTPPITRGFIAFEGVNHEIPVYVPSSALADYQAAAEWKEFNLLPWDSSPFTVGKLEYKITDIGTRSVMVLGYHSSSEKETNLFIPMFVNHNGITYKTTSIRDYAFYGNKKLQHLNLQADLTSIGESSFSNCDSLQSVSISNTIRNIGDWAFAYCPQLSDFRFPAYGVTNIGTGSFYGSALTQVTIPNSVTSIGQQAFNTCNHLKQINIGSGVTNIGGSFVCDSLVHINVDEGNTTYSSEDGVLFNKDKTRLLQYPIGKPDSAYILPNSVTTIGSWAFGYCKELKQVTLPQNLTDIEMYAFFGCKNFTQMTVLATVPPTAELHNTFFDVNRDIPVYVPAAALADYQADNVWSAFNLQALPITGLQTPSMPESIRMEGGLLHNPQQLHLTLYDMQGRQVYNGNDATVSLTAGVYVVRCAGASGKVVF